MGKLKFAILSFAHIHAWSYASVLKDLEKENEVEFVAVYDDDPERLKKAAEAYGVKQYSDYIRLLEVEKPDAVIVTSENAKHISQVLAACEKGIHVLCEKPIATTLKDADEMIRAVEKSGVKFQTAFVMRYHEVTVETKRIIDEGSIGEIVAITSTNHGKYPGLWFGDPDLAGGGAIMDHTVHNADLMRWYTKDEAKEVYAIYKKNIRDYLKVEDNALITIRFKKGVVASIDCSWSRPDSWPIWGDVYLGVFGTEGYIVVDAFRSFIILAPDKGAMTSKYFGTNPDYEMIKDFIRVIKEDDAPRATVYDGRQALEIALAAYKSLEKKAPVELPL